ncbi:MAG TPA: LLM class flavin-dependent oxidoreductase [Thermomicrobiales bacterium]|nr:LLM class flavin-dependent oxidoreductase [Thermomicrobiales bacterium]
MTDRARPLKIGFGLPDAEGLMEGGTARWSDLADMARVAEDAGFDSLWVQDHLLFRLEGQQQESEGPWESFSLLAALGAVTERVELGTLVTCTSFRNPALTAKIADTIDEISGGRVILGLGAGWHEPEYRAFGFPFDHRVSRFEEALAIIAGLLREGAIDFEGRYYSARDCELRPRGPRPRGLPLMLGSTSPRMLGLAARHADAWNAYFTRIANRASGVPAVREIVDAACVEAGRDPATLERTVAAFVDFSGSADGASSMNPTGAPALTGTVGELAEEMRAFAREGISHVQVHIEPATPAGLEQFGRVLEALDR